MKRIFTILCICLCVIPLFAVPSSAASYDLGTPKRLYYTTGLGLDAPTWKFAPIYVYDYDTETLATREYRLMNGRVFSFYADNYSGTAQADGIFELGTKFIDTGTNQDFFGRKVLVTGFDPNSPFWCFQTNDDVRSSLYFDSFVYENLFIPFEGQYFRVSFTFDAVLTNVPQPVLDFIDINTLCFICDTSGRAGYRDKYSLPKVFPSTTAVTKTEKNTYKYDFFFSLTDTAFSSIEGSMCLGLRIPFYFNTVASYENGIKLFTNAELPSTYEIITIGGYDQALDDIKNSVDSLKTDIIDFYTDQDSSDVAFISDASNAFDEGKNVVNDYNNANDKIQQLVTGAVIPDMQDIIDEQVGLTGDLLDPVKEIFQNTYIVSAFLICFAFCLISVLLYGIRG